MARELERDLGLYATITISIGAMIGSGIFVLPGEAAQKAGPAVPLAYLLAGLVVLPAALSKAEMATAMPEAGGTYLYIDRAMGPLPGTIAGIGAWFSLVFKSAFAVVGLGAYLLIFVPGSGAVVEIVGLGLAVVLLVVNTVGVKQTGRFQAVIVSVVLLALLVFIADGLTYVDQTMFHPFFSEGPDGLFAATGFVFVSYAGVTKIASVAEEVEYPGRNIPAGILVSIAVMMLVYTFVAFVIVGVTPLDALSDTKIPMAVAAAQFMGEFGMLAVAGVAVISLLSMANAGVLSSSRFPLAMSRDSLAPAEFSAISDRFRTPVVAIAVTGALLLVLIAFVPVFELAKLASAFQILVFSFVNTALMAFRESDLDSYDPEFVAPGYPWVQIFGLVSGLALLTQMGLVPLAGAGGIIVLGAVWYRVYGRSRTSREGAALDAIRRSRSDSSIESIRSQLEGENTDVLVALGPETTLGSRGTLLEVAAHTATQSGGTVAVVRFSEVPQQVPLASAAEAEGTPFAEEASTLADRFGVPVTTEEIVSHDTESAVSNYVRDHAVGVTVGEWVPDRFTAEFLGEDVDWYMKHCRSDLVFVRDRGLGDVGEIAVVADQGPYAPMEVFVADAIAEATGAELRFLYALDPEATGEQADSVRSYHDDLAAVCDAPTSLELLRTNDRRQALTHAADGADLAVASTSAHHVLYDVVFGTLPDALATELNCTVLLVHASESRSSTFLRYLLERLAF